MLFMCPVRCSLYFSFASFFFLSFMCLHVLLRARRYYAQNLLVVNWIRLSFLIWANLILLMNVILLVNSVLLVHINFATRDCNVLDFCCNTTRESNATCEIDTTFSFSGPDGITLKLYYS